MRSELSSSPASFDTRDPELPAAVERGVKAAIDRPRYSPRRNAIAAPSESADGKTAFVSRFTHVFVRRKGAWVCISGQSTPLPAG